MVMVGPVVVCGGQERAVARRRALARSLLDPEGEPGIMAGCSPVHPLWLVLDGPAGGGPLGEKGLSPLELVEVGVRPRHTNGRLRRRR